MGQLKSWNRFRGPRSKQVSQEWPSGHLRLHFVVRALGHFIFSLIGLKRILFTNLSKSLKSST